MTKKPSSIKEVRTYYGMTQQALADHLQVNRGLLSMAELGNRELPVEAGNQLRRLHLAMLNPAAPNRGKAFKSNQNKLKSRTLEKANYRLSVNHYKLRRAERALAKMQSGHSRATCMLTSLEALRENATPGELALFGVLANEAELLYNKTGEDTQLNLELRMEAIKAETSFLKTKFKGIL
jgi:transcriptional regulator with XRE-family HTH domain